MAGLQCVQIEILQVIKVAQLSDLVVADVQPLQRVGNERVVEPLQGVARDVEPLQLAEGGHDAVEVREAVVIQPQPAELAEALEGCLWNCGQPDAKETIFLENCQLLFKK